MACIDTPIRNLSATASPGRPALSRVLSSSVEAVQTWRRRLHGRAQLRNMPDYLLRDVGIDIATARREADKPFWRA